MVKQIEKKIHVYVQLTGEYPSQIEMTQKEYDELENECNIINNKIMNLKIVINNKIDKFKIK